MKPFMFRLGNGDWYAHSCRNIASGSFAFDRCPFVAYSRWMEQSIKAGEQ